MPSTSVFGFLRKARRFWFSGEESLELEASPDAHGISAKVDKHVQRGPVTFHLACMGKIRRKCTDMKKLVHAGSFGKQVQPSARKPGVLGGRNKVQQALPAAEAMAAPPRFSGTKAAIGGIRMNQVAVTPCRKTEEVSLWKRRTQAEPPRLQIDCR